MRESGGQAWGADRGGGDSEAEIAEQEPIIGRGRAEGRPNQQGKRTGAGASRARKTGDRRVVNGRSDGGRRAECALGDKPGNARLEEGRQAE